MPVIARFPEVVIRMYYLPREHNPPHVHAVCNDCAAAVAIASGEVLDGELPPRTAAEVRSWIARYRDELLEMWETQRFYRVEQKAGGGHVS